MGKTFIRPFDRFLRSMLKSKKKYLKRKKEAAKAHRDYEKYIRIQRNHKSIEWGTYTEYSKPQGNVRLREMKGL